MESTNTETPVAKTTPVAKKAPAAKAKAPAKKAAPSKGKASAKRGRDDRFADVGDLEGKKVKLLVKENPKKGNGAKRFAYYKNGASVADAMKKGVTRADVRWDVAHKFIALH